VDACVQTDNRLAKTVCIFDGICAHIHVG